MLKFIRDNLRKLAPILWLVIAAFVLLVFADFQDPGQGGAPNSTAASVAGRNITFADFQRQYQNVETRWRQIYGENYSPDLAKQLGLPMQAMNDLVAQKILLLEAERMGLAATKAEIRKAILELPVFQDAQGRFVGEEQYRRVLDQNRIDTEDFEADMGEQVLLQKLNLVLARSAWVGEAELEQEARREAETATIRYLELDPTSLQEEPELDEAAIVSYFEQNRETYRLPERRRVGYLSVKTNEIRAGLEIPEADLRNYYDQNTAEFTQPEQVRAQHILLFTNDQRDADAARQQLEQAKARIEAGEDFATVAGELSEDEATRDRGGDLGFFQRGRMTPQFEQAAFAAEEGALVGPVENQLGPRTGFHLIKINAKQPGGQQPFEQVENRIRVRLLNDRSREASETRARALYERLQDEAIASEEDLRAIAEREGVSVDITEPVSSDDTIPGIGRQTAFATTAFQHQPGQISEPIQIAAGWALLDVLEITPPQLPDLEQVRDRVAADAVAERKAEIVRERLEQAAEKVAAGAQDLEQTAAELGVELATSSAFGVRGAISGLTDSRAVIDRALELEVGELGGPIEIGQSTVLFEVTDRSRFDPATFASEKETKREELRLQRMNSLLQSLINQRRDQLDVTYSRDFLANFELDSAPDTL